MVKNLWQRGHLWSPRRIRCSCGPGAAADAPSSLCPDVNLHLSSSIVHLLAFSSKRGREKSGVGRHVDRLGLWGSRFVMGGTAWSIWRMPGGELVTERGADRPIWLLLNP